MLGRILGQLNPLQNRVTRLIKMVGVSIIDANSSVAAHATTMDPWSLGNYVTLTGSAVTFTAMANAPQAGAEVELYMNAAHIFTDGAVFEVDGDANYTATIGDRVLIRAKSTTVFTVHPRKKDGTAVVSSVTAGQVIQVVSVDKTDTFTTTSQTFADVTGMSKAITVASTSNKVLVTVVFSGGSATGTSGMLVKIVRGSTDIFIGDAASNRIRSSGAVYGPQNANASTFQISYLDSPATAGAVTYKLQIRTTAAGTVYFGRGVDDTDNTDTGRFAATIILSEVKG